MSGKICSRQSAFRLVGNVGQRCAWMATSALHAARQRFCTSLMRRAIRICPLGIVGLERRRLRGCLSQAAGPDR